MCFRPQTPYRGNAPTPCRLCSSKISFKNPLIVTHTKQAIPDDEYSGIVFVDAVAVDSVVNSMVTWSVQNVLEWT